MCIFYQFIQKIFENPLALLCHNDSKITFLKIKRNKFSIFVNKEIL